MEEGRAETQDAAAETADAGEAATGRALVRAVLVDPLRALRRPRGVSAAAHEAALEKLVGQLAYLDARALGGLAEVALRHAGAVSPPTCPHPALIRAWAYALKCPPPSESDYAASLIRSELGRRAMAEGWVVPLLRIARRLGPPPGRYVIVRLMDDAEDARRRMREIEEQAAAGAAGAASLAWLEAWRRDMDWCRQVQSAQELPA